MYVRLNYSCATFIAYGFPRFLYFHFGRYCPQGERYTDVYSDAGSCEFFRTKRGPNAIDRNCGESELHCFVAEFVYIYFGRVGPKLCMVNHSGELGSRHVEFSSSEGFLLERLFYRKEGCHGERRGGWCVVLRQLRVRTSGTERWELWFILKGFLVICYHIGSWGV